MLNERNNSNESCWVDDPIGQEVYRTYRMYTYDEAENHFSERPSCPDSFTTTSFGVDLDGEFIGLLSELIDYYNDTGPAYEDTIFWLRTQQDKQPKMIPDLFVYELMKAWWWKTKCKPRFMRAVE